ncbi:MAG TPA: hypothetical protein VE861_13125 [Gemmatimonadaceae bacterium]|nr:hypothetical protein [Gemmatimonadaceae bacterium]
MSVTATRQQRMRRGIVALRDVTRALRGTGSARAADGTEQDRSALIDLASMADRLEGFAEDQGADDWGEFWVTQHDVVTMRAHLDLIVRDLRGVSPDSMPALRVLVQDLALLAHADD